MKKVLLTGFGPYGNTPTNPAQLTADALGGREIAGATIISRIVPNVFFDSISAAKHAIAEIGPQLVIMLGEYGGRAMVTVERLAQNLNDSRRYGLADNAGRVLVGEPTVPGGPVAYHATAPIHEMVLAMRRAGVPADISDTPGTFVCNHLMYGVLHHLAEENLSVPAGWIHLPQLPSVAALDRNLGNPSMSLETSAMAVEAGIAAALERPDDANHHVLSRFQI